MIKVGFYVDNSRISDVDCGGIADGNPGIGGTEYLFYLTTWQIQQLPQNDVSVTLLTSNAAMLPDLDIVVVGSKQDAINYCKENHYDILVIKFEQKDCRKDNQLLSSKNTGGVKIVIWAHNVIPNHLLTRMHRLGGVSAIVNVGREQLDLYRDHQMFYRSTYIYNGIPLKPYEYYRSNSASLSDRKHEVTYLGSLIPVKGFHILAKIWKDIVKEVPDAHLNVIGSGKVYNQNQKLGRYGLAEESYEKEFMPFITDENGEILDSVTFFGKLGPEKYTILARTKVGVPNPAGTTETFCLSAVEMAIWGARIVSKKYVGLIDTVTCNVGILVNDSKQLTYEIIKALTSDIANPYVAYKFIDKNFNITHVANAWIYFFQQLYDRHITINSLIVNSDYNLKSIRELNRRIKKKLLFGQYLPTVDTWINILSRLIRREIYKIKY